LVKNYGFVKILKEIVIRMCIELGIFEPDFNKILDEIVIIDRDFKITLVNTEFCKNYNVTKEEAVDSYCYKIIPDLNEPCSLDKYNCPLIHSIETKKGSRCLHKRSIKGKTILIEQFTIPIKSKNGEIQSICIIGKKARAYATGDTNNIDSDINLKQKMNELCQDIQNYVELSIYFLKKHRNEGDVEILLREILKITKFGKELLLLLS